MRAALMVALVLATGSLLGSCAKRDPLVSNAEAKPVGNWRVERQIDRVTGAPLSSAFLMTSQSSNSLVAYPQPAQLQLACFKGQPIVRLVFDFKVGSNRNAFLGYRFDEKPGREANARFLQSYRTVVIEEHAEVTKFIADLATSKTLYLRIRSLNAGRSSAEFQLHGAPQAIEAAFADCPLPAAKPTRRASA